jgi:hypothetical protein
MSAARSSATTRRRCTSTACSFFAITTFPPGATHLTYATSTSADNATTTFDIDASVLRHGRNVVAVAVHPQSHTSSDLSFDFRLTAVVTPIPEPSGLALAMFGIAAMGVMHRVRTRRAEKRRPVVAAATTGRTAIGAARQAAE